MRGPVTVQFTSTFDAHADEVWGLMRRLDTFTYLVRGLFGAPALSGRTDIAEPGKEGSGWLFLLHVIPLHRHHIEVVEADAATRTIRTREHGGMVKRWEHTLHAEALPDGRCRYSDTVVLDGGWATPLVAAFARIAYPYRHRRWPKLLRLRRAQERTQPRV